MRRMSSLFVLCLLSSVSAQQRVWTVDDTAATNPDFTNLQTAINRVANGDVLLVRSGVYGHVRLNAKALTIVAGAGAGVTPDVGGAEVSAIPAGASARLQGLNFTDQLWLHDSPGTVWVESCRCTGLDRKAGLLVENSSSVALLAVNARGGHPQDCTSGFGTGGNGLDQSNSSVHCYGCTFTGGADSTEYVGVACCLYYERGGSGIVTHTGADFLFLSGCGAQGGYTGLSTWCDGTCRSQLPGGDGLVVLGAGTVEVLDSGLYPGGGRDCSFQQVFGAPYVGPVRFLPGRALRITPLQPARENGVAALHIEGPPHVLVRMGTGDTPGTLPVIDLLRGTLLLAPTPAPLVRTLGITDAAGVLDSSIALGPFLPGVDARITFQQVFYLQPEAVFARRAGAQLDDFVLGQGTMLVGLDERF